MTEHARSTNSHPPGNSEQHTNSELQGAPSLAQETTPVCTVIEKGFVGQFCRNIGAQTPESRCELLAHAEAVLNEVEITYDVFLRALTTHQLGSMLTPAEEIRFHDEALEFLASCNGVNPRRLRAIVEGLLEEPKINTLYQSEVLTYRAGLLYGELEKLLVPALESSAEDRERFARSIEKLFDDNQFRRPHPELLAQLLSSIHTEQHDKEVVLRKLKRFYNGQPPTEREVVATAYSDLGLFMRDFRQQMVREVIEHIAPEQMATYLDEARFVRGAKVASHNDTIITTLAGLDTPTARGYRAEQITANLLQDYCIQETVGEVHLSLPYSRSDRALHSDLYAAGQPIDVKSSVTTFMYGVAEALAIPTDEFTELDHYLAETFFPSAHCELPGAECSAYTILTRAAYSRDPEPFAILNKAIEEETFLYGSSTGLQIFYRPQLVLTLAQSPLLMIEHLEKTLGVVFDPLQNQKGLHKLTELKESLRKHLHSTQHSFQTFARRVHSEFLLLEGDYSPAVKRQSTITILEHIYRFGSGNFLFKDKKLYDEQETNEVIVHPKDTRNSLQAGFSDALVEIWEDLGLVTFDEHGKRLLINGLPGLLHDEDNLPLKVLLSSFLTELQKGEVHIPLEFEPLLRLLEEVPTRQGVPSAQHIRSLLPQVGQICASLVSSLDGAHNLKMSSGSLAHATRDTYINIWGSSLTSIVEGTGALTFASNGQRVLFER